MNTEIMNKETLDDILDLLGTERNINHFLHNAYAPGRDLIRDEILNQSNKPEILEYEIEYALENNDEDRLNIFFEKFLKYLAQDTYKFSFSKIIAWDRKDLAEKTVNKFSSRWKNDAKELTKIVEIGTHYDILSDKQKNKLISKLKKSQKNVEENSFYEVSDAYIALGEIDLALDSEIKYGRLDRALNISNEHKIREEETSKKIISNANKEFEPYLLNSYLKAAQKLGEEKKLVDILDKNKEEYKDYIVSWKAKLIETYNLLGEKEKAKNILYLEKDKIKDQIQKENNNGKSYFGKDDDLDSLLKVSKKLGEEEVINYAYEELIDYYAGERKNYRKASTLALEMGDEKRATLYNKIHELVSEK